MSAVLAVTRNVLAVIGALCLISFAAIVAWAWRHRTPGDS